MPTTRADKKDFVLAFIANSREMKREYIETWREVIDNFMVRPGRDFVSSVEYPYGRAQYRKNSSADAVVLKDAETHKAIMTYASKLVTAIFGDPRGEYVQASAVGWEDADLKAPTVTRLMRYAFGIPGHFMTMVEAVVDMLLMGTSIIEVGWRFEEREMPVRRLETIGGATVDSSSRQLVTSYDDVDLNVVDNEDFFPDPSEHRLERMSGAGKRFRMNAMTARSMAERGIYSKAAVERAINEMAKSDVSRQEDDFRRGLDQPDKTETLDDFKEMIGFEYWGDVPWEDDVGSSRRVITVLNNQLVRDAPYPFGDPALPFHALKINPVQGRFYGVSPGEVIRFDQDLQDVLKILLAEAVVRQVHPPLIYDNASEADLDALRAWRIDAPIGVRGGPAAVSTLQYGANVFAGFQLGNELRNRMQEASGALGLLQGSGLGTSRASATEANFSFQNALDRPELAAMVIERDALPRIGLSILRRYQQFLPDDVALRERVGEMPGSVWIGDIMGDFDIKFVGARMAMSRQQRLQAFDRLIAMSSAVPAAGAMVPWQLMLGRLIGDDLELADVASLIGDPATVKRNITLQLLLQQTGSGNGNQTAPTTEPAGTLPAQAVGNVSEP